MIRHRRDVDVVFATGGEAPEADVVEQHQSTDPIALAEIATSPATPPVEADPADVAEQGEAIAFGDELRAETSTQSFPDSERDEHAG